jgi:dTDP-4-amino-4,6-dideoxygalactose transaminase
VSVIEDAAQALGCRDAQGRWLGLRGRAGFFSFARGKNVTGGAGGLIVTAEAELAERLRAEAAALPARGLMRQGKDFALLLAMAILVRPSLYWLPAGMPFLRLGETAYEPDFPLERLPRLAASLLWGWPRRLASLEAARRRHARAYAGRLRAARTPPRDLPYIRLPALAPDAAARERLFAGGEARRLGLSAMYPSAVPDIPELRARLSGTRCPGARDLAQRLFTLPTHAFLSDKDRESVIALVESRCAPRKGAAAASTLHSTAGWP